MPKAEVWVLLSGYSHGEYPGGVPWTVSASREATRWPQGTLGFQMLCPATAFTGPERSSSTIWWGQQEAGRDAALAGRFEDSLYKALCGCSGVRQ